jgi:hypothetical protein
MLVWVKFVITIHAWVARASVWSDVGARADDGRLADVSRELICWEWFETFEVRFCVAFT